MGRPGWAMIVDRVPSAVCARAWVNTIFSVSVPLTAIGFAAGVADEIGPFEAVARKRGGEGKGHPVVPHLAVITGMVAHADPDQLGNRRHQVGMRDLAARVAG